MKLISAHARNRVIGRNGVLPWHIKEELQWFNVFTTKHQNVLFGRKTYEDLQHVSFKNRRIFVLSTTMSPQDGVTIFRSHDEVLEFAKHNVLVVAGGQHVYEQFLPYCHELFITTVYGDFEGDAYFPEYKHLFRESEKIIEHAKFETSRYVRR